MSHSIYTQLCVHTLNHTTKHIIDPMHKHTAAFMHWIMPQAYFWVIAPCDMEACCIATHLLNHHHSWLRSCKRALQCFPTTIEGNKWPSYIQVNGSSLYKFANITNMSKVINASWFFCHESSPRQRIIQGLLLHQVKGKIRWAIHQYIWCMLFYRTLDEWIRPNVSFFCMFFWTALCLLFWECRLLNYGFLSVLLRLVM